VRQDNAIAFVGESRGENGPVPSRRTPKPTRRVRSTPRPTRRARRTPQPTRRPPSAARRDERARTRIVRRNTFKTDECDGNVRNLSGKCSELNRLVCSLHRRELESRERRLCERVGLEIGTGGRRRSRPRYEEEYDEEEYDSMDSEDEEEFDSMDSEDEEDVFMEEE